MLDNNFVFYKSSKFFSVFHILISTHGASDNNLNNFEAVALRNIEPSQ